jgi:hypothetical protein
MSLLPWVLVKVHANNVVNEHSTRVGLLANEKLDEGPHVGVVAHQALHGAVVQCTVVAAATRHLCFYTNHAAILVEDHLYEMSLIRICLCMQDKRD